MKDLAGLEEDQLSKFLNYWKENKSWLLKAILASVLVYAGITYYNHHGKVYLDKASEHYFMITSAEASGDNATVTSQAEKLIADYPSTKYAQLARLILAKQEVDAKNWDLAVSRYNSVIATQPSGPLSAIAKLRKARVQYWQLNNKDAALESLSTQESNFQSLFYEAIGDIHFHEKEYDLAKENYNKANETAARPNALLSLKLMNLGVDVSKS